MTITFWQLGPFQTLITTCLMELLTLCIFDCGNAQLVPPENHACACPGSVLTFNCTTVGLGTTIWTGTAFDCSNMGNQITLRNLNFASGTFGTCNNGRISARGVEVNDDRRISQLNVTVSSALNETSIECQYNVAGQGIVNIGVAVLTVLQSDYPPPGKVKLTNVSREGLVFTWNPIAPVCPSIKYRISAPDCGTCPTEISTALANCTNLQSLTEKRICRFSVQSIMCGAIGNQSNPLLASVGVPEPPRVTITPYYINDTQKLMMLNITITDHASNTNTGILLIDNITTYTIFINSSSGHDITLNTTILDNSIDAPPFCSSTAMLNVFVSAINIFGEGPLSGSEMIGCTNQFLKLDYEPSTTIISCHFNLTEPADSVVSERSCTVRYRKCQEEDYQTTSIEDVTTNPIELKLSVSEGTYCFEVTASISSSTSNSSVIVGGEITVLARDVIPDSVIAIITVVIIVIIAATVLLCILIILLYVAVKHSRKSVETEDDNMRPIISYEHFSITWNPLAEENYENLQQFCDKHNFPANTVFLKYGKENSNYLKYARDVIVFKKTKSIKYGLQGKLFTNSYALDMVKEGQRDTNDTVTWFVLWDYSMECITLSKGAAILHQNPTLEAVRYQFYLWKVKQKKTMNEFLHNKLGILNFEIGNTFYLFGQGQHEDLQYYKEVIRVPNEKMENGEVMELPSRIKHFYDIPGVPGKNIESPWPNTEGYHVFLQNTSESQKSRILEADSWLLYKKKKL